jgi:processive 1,2-diacylglycerol beta-glucosyltransferase
VNDVATMAHKIDGVLGDAGRLQQLRANVARIARPRAAYEVVERSQRFLRSVAATGR